MFKAIKDGLIIDRDNECDGAIFAASKSSDEIKASVDWLKKF